MESGIKIAQIWGIPIRLHLSWFVIFGLVTWSLASGILPAAYPNLSSSAVWGISALTSLLFAGSVLLHELGHAYLALRSGVPVRQVTLFIFGGVAQITREPATPGAEFRIAIAGPAVSLALAAVFGGLYLLDRQIPLLAAPSEWLARINLMLGLFNLIPGFPLDGGRVLRAIAWKRTGNFQRATRIATSSGQLVAFGFIGVGIFNILSGSGLFNGLWLIFIGWFLQNAAASSYAHVTLQQMLGGVTVEQVMNREPVSVPALTRLDTLIHDHVLNSGQRVFLIMDEGTHTLRGMLTLAQVNTVAREQWPVTTVGQAMLLPEQIMTVTAETPLFNALQQMDDANVAQAPVMAGRAVIGLLQRDAVLHYVRTRAEVGV